MQRIDIIRRVAAQDGLIVVNLGFPARELFVVKDRPANFYMLGSMGLASSIGLGLALSQPETVYVIEGDGALLMNLGSLATIAREAPPEPVHGGGRQWRVRQHRQSADCPRGRNRPCGPGARCRV
jgi:sulfopyruvate decarboxylase subunit beta